MGTSVYRISRDGKPLATLANLEDLDRFGRDVLSGVYNVDVIQAEPIEGLTSWRWGRVVKHLHGIVTLDRLGG